MAFVQEHVFKYPAEEECLVRRLGSGVIVNADGYITECDQHQPPP